MQEDEVNEYKNVKERENVVYTEDTKMQFGQHDGISKQVTMGYQGRMQQAPRSTPLTNLLYSEDMRISRILRRLMCETHNSAAALEICEKLELAVRSPSNVQYICRSFDMLLDNLTQILKQCPVEVLPEVSNILGLIGYINRSNFPVYKNYITKTYQSSKSLRKYLMQALKTTFKCDAVNLDLIVFSERVLEVLIDYLENSEKADIFISISDTILEFSKHYEIAFAEHFTDIVDIVVGWHLETDQPQSLKLHCALVLQRWAAYFLNELNFTYGLLGQFIEDINAWLEDLTSEGASNKTKHKAELRIAAFVGAFTTIFKSLATPAEFIGLTADIIFIENAVSIIIKAAKETVVLNYVGEEITLNVNDFLSLLLTYNFKFKDVTFLEELIKLQIQHLENYNEKQIGGLLYLIVCYLRNQRTALSCTFLTFLLSSENKNFDSIKFSKNKANYKLYLKIYHDILLLKNVILLQEAYKHIKAGIHSSMNVIMSVKENENENTNEFHKAVQTINFYLSAISILATQTSSIISMYALDPSILELLIHNCKAADVILWQTEPCLHNALIQLISQHCQKNNNFITTSRLLHDQQYISPVLEEQIRNSPTSEHFTQIIQFFAAAMEHVEKQSLENLKLLLNWLEQLLDICRAQISILCSNKYFLSICKSLHSAGLHAPLESAKCMRLIIISGTHVPNEILVGLKSLAIYLMNSPNKTIRNTYTEILAILPLNVALTPIDMQIESSKQLNKLSESKKWYQGTQHYAPLRPKYFKEFLDYLDWPFSAANRIEQPSNDRLIENIFSKCFIDQNIHENAVHYQNIARQHNTLITSWVQNEAARYCVQNKLRTTIGKPQETFLGIEAIVMKYARMLNVNESKDNQNDNELITLKDATELQHRAYLLLGFLEALEKHIYNAAQGTAFAMPPAEKPAKTFFRINASTCNEWFKRIRPSVGLIATNCLDPEIALRYSEQTLTKVTQINTTLLEHTLINMVEALLTCKEADSLTGLYVWIRAQTGKSYTWIQCAAEQASGHLETACSRYKAILDENHVRIDDHIKNFIMNQLLYCLYFTAQWKEIRELLQKYAAESKKDPFKLLNNARSYAHLDTMEMIFYGKQQQRQKMVHNDNETNLQMSEALMQLMDWSTVEDYKVDGYNISKELNSFSSYQIFHKLEDHLIVQSLKIKQQEQESLSKDINHTLRACLEDCATSSAFWHTSWSANFLLLNYISKNCLANDIERCKHLQDVSKLLNEDVIDTNMLTKSVMWSLLSEQRTIPYNSNGSEYINAKQKLYLDLATNARQDGNLNYCRKMLERFFAIKGFDQPLGDITQSILNKQQEIDVNDIELLHGINELSKCLYMNGNNQTNTIQQYQAEAINLSSILCLQIVEQTQEQQIEKKYPSIGAQTLNTLADWLGQRNLNANNVNSINLENLPQLHELLDKLNEPLLEFNDKKLEENIPTIDKAIGKLYNESTLQRTDVADTWLAYGNWCYRWGKKLVELKMHFHALSNKNSENELSERDLNELGSILKQNFSQELLSDISQVLQRHQFNSKIDAADDDLESNFTGSALELIEQELREIDALKNLTSDDIMNIIRIWRRTHKTVYAYYESAIKAYLKYLNLETSSSSSTSTLTSNKTNDDCGFVTTTLRILRLVVKHAFALQEVLEAGLNTTPLRPWKVIIPQLFSRLNHHEPYVRKSLAQLLCRLAEDEPHAVIFPAVVGSQQESHQQSLQNDSNEQNLKDLSTSTTALSNCFGALVSKLSEQAPQTVCHVQLLVKELRRVALLGEEYWLHTLGRLLTEYSSLFSALVIELRKCNRTNIGQMEKFKAKHELLLQYVIADLQKIAMHTEKQPETNYEQSFKAHYETQIQETLAKLKTAEIIEAGPVESWQQLKNLYQRFQQRSMHGLSTAASTLKINDLSSILGNMRDTAISMPGVAPKQGKPVYIKAIENTIHILPTKTRPKKLIFLGNDGQKYTYLFKGLEDLHLDERIMQFLSISNLMMQRTRDRRHQNQVFRAHYYSVIPLGPQSGLISWVDGVTPLFAIYKKWQQRDAALKQQQNKEQSQKQQQLQQQQASSASSQLNALRPSEMFYKKLRPLLTAQNIKLKDSRKQWPLNILRRVLDELTEETPSDLLSKELWTTATSAAEWHTNVRNYSISTAVMSVIGYVIGLGDRHLDNVLINLCSGEIVHIDYNVCFEKGKTLRVPEKVPFRMTPNFENALGVTGVEGSFRLGCEYVLKTLRKEKETLLTLLEAFVYDPLVDWTVSDDGVSGGTTRSTLAYTAMQAVTSVKPAINANSTANVLPRESPIRMTKQYEVVQRKKEWEIMQQTIKARFEDIRSHWSEYIDEIEQILQKIEGEKDELKLNTEKINQIEDERNKLNQQVAMIRELEMLGTAIGSHSLNTLTQRFQTYKQDAQSIVTLRKSAETALKDIEILLISYFENIIGDGSELVSMQNELMQQENIVYINEFEAMRSYIEQISTKLYEDVNFGRKEMDNSLQQQARTSLECIKLLMQYSQIMNYYPRSYLRTKNALFRYADWYRQLSLENTNLSKLKMEVERCHNSDIEIESFTDVDKMRVVQYAGLMEKTLYELNMSSHQLLAVEEHMRQQQQLSNVEDIVQEIKDFADLDDKTRITLQVAILQVLTEALTQLDSGDGAQNLLKEIDYIQNISLIFEHLDLKANTVQQQSEQKMLKSLEGTLKALNDLELNFGFEIIVQLFFNDDDLKLQNQLKKLCNGEFDNIQNETTNEKLRSLLKYLGKKFYTIEMELLQLQQIVQEILDVETCSWYNILLERLCVVRSLKDVDLYKWRSQTISELFTLARENVNSIKTHRIEMIYDARLLFSSIGINVRSLYNNYLKGLTLALSEAYISSFQMNLNFAETNAAARLLGNKLISVLHHNFEMTQLHLQILQNNKISENFTYVASAYVWVNHTLLSDMLPNLTHIILKESLLSIISNVSQSLSAWKHTIIKIQDDILQNTKILEQRLSWIIGKTTESENDAENYVISRFEQESAAQTTRFNFFSQLAIKLNEHINVLLQFETLMADSSSGLNTRHKAEASFLALIEEWQQARNRYGQSCALITPVEKSIVELLDPEDKVDACWIANISGLLEELSFGVQKNLSSLQEVEKTIQQNFYQYANELQSLTDNPLRTDMRQLLRLIIKNAKYPTKGSGASSNLTDETYLTNSARELLQLLKSLFGKLGDLKTKLYLRDDYDSSATCQIDERVRDVKFALNQQRKELNSLIQNYLEQSNCNIRSNSASPARVASPAADRKEETIEKKGEQKRNAYAVSVWKRIRMKLEGRDPDTNRRSSIAEQIDFIINEATNRDNLAMLYEGWTPWV